MQHLISQILHISSQSSTHGDYPKEQVIENPEFTVSGVDDEGMTNAWTYYVNQLNASDRFISSLIDRLSKR